VYILLLFALVFCATPYTLGKDAIPPKNRKQELKSRIAHLQELKAEIPLEALELSVINPQCDSINPEWENSVRVTVAEVCSLQIEAALTYLEGKSLELQIQKLENQSDSIASEKIRVYSEINRLERNYASHLKLNLDQVRLKARERQEEAQRKFEALQSDLINVSTTARGTILSMSDILFRVGSAEVGADLKTNLAKIAGILLVYKEAQVVIEGHTDNVGRAELNQELSFKRAEEVQKFLVSLGVNESRLKAEGFGFTRPVADNSLPEGRKKNRRVDLVIAPTQKSAAP